MPRNLTACARMVVDAPEVIPIRHRRERPVERQDLEPVPRQVQLANDFRTKQRDDGRTDRVLEAGMKLLGDGRAADQVAPFEDQDFAPRPREIRGVHETVMPAANDDDVVIHACSNRTLRRKQNAGNLVRRARELRGRRFGSRAGKASTWLHSTPAGRSGSTNLVFNEGLRPSGSPTRALARRFDGSLRSRGSLARSLATLLSDAGICDIGSSLVRGSRFAPRPRTLGAFATEIWYRCQSARHYTSAR